MTGGEWRRPARVGFVVLPPAGVGTTVSVYLMHLPDGEPMLLESVAALIWVLAVEGEVDVPGALAELIGEPRDAIADQVERYVGVLAEQGWLERAE